MSSLLGLLSEPKINPHYSDLMTSLEPSCRPAAWADLAWPELELANRNPIHTRKKNIHWSKIQNCFYHIDNDSSHLAPGHAQVGGGKVPAEEALAEAPGDVGVSADQWESSIKSIDQWEASIIRGWCYLIIAPGLRAVQTTELTNQPIV